MSREPRPFYGGTNAEESGLPPDPQMERACFAILAGTVLLILVAVWLLVCLL